MGPVAMDSANDAEVATPRGAHSTPLPSAPTKVRVIRSCQRDSGPRSWSNKGERAG